MERNWVGVSLVGAGAVLCPPPLELDRSRERLAVVALGAKGVEEECEMMCC